MQQGIQATKKKKTDQYTYVLQSDTYNGLS